MAITQLPMFIDGKTIWNNIFDGKWEAVDNDDHDPDAEDLYDSKLYESMHERGSDGCPIHSNYESLYDCITECGIAQPVVMRVWYYGENVALGNGHHRSVCAAELGQWVPVVWSDNGAFANSWLDAQDGNYQFSSCSES